MPNFRAGLPVTLLALAALAHTGGDPLRLGGVLLSSPTGSDPTTALVAAIALVAWASAAWLLLVAGLLLLNRTSGRVGRLAGALGRAVAPAAVHRALAVALGLTVLAGTTAPAVAATGAGAVVPHPAPISVTFDWPTGPAAGPTAPAAAREAVVVAPGDSLWRLAERALPGRPSAGQVAAAWPTWWSANREVIGLDPGLLHPGTRLVPPNRPAQP